MVDRILITHHIIPFASQPCGTGAVDGTFERSQNFKKVLETFSSHATLPEVAAIDTSVESKPSVTLFAPEVSSPNSSPSSVDDKRPALEHVGAANPFQDPVPNTQMEGTHFCNEHTNLPSDSKAVDIVYQYEVVPSHSMDLSDTLHEVKKEVMTSLTDSLGCTDAPMRRRLRDTVYEDLIGIQGGIDEVDSDAESCSMASFSGCLPIVGHLTGYFGNSSTDADIQKTEDQILFIIQQGMLQGRYNSDQVRWIAFRTDDATSASLEKVYVIPHDNSSQSIWVPFASTLICVLIIAIVIVSVLLFKEMRNDQVLPPPQSVIDKLQALEEHSSDESSDDSLLTEEILCPDDVVEMQESQDLDISVPRRKHLLCDADD